MSNSWEITSSHPSLARIVRRRGRTLKLQTARGHGPFSRSLFRNRIRTMMRISTESVPVILLRNPNW
jgi:hypothetical protein